MRILCGLLIGALSFCSWSSRATETASATIFCYSLQFQRGTEPNGFYSLNLTSINGGINGELALDFLGLSYSHSAYLALDDELFGETLAGDMELDVPDGGDANGDGFYDFFQVSQGVTNLTSSGTATFDIYGTTSVAATWNRAAGSSYGTCFLKMTLMGQSITFTHTFQVLEYRGVLNYVSGANNVTGTVSLTQTENPSATMNGAVEFKKSISDRFNELTLEAGTWTNESQQAMSHLSDTVSRDSDWPTNYYSYLEFVDNSDQGAFYPYGVWVLSIDDTNDVNHNGIPDFSDDPGSTPTPRAPLIEIATSSTNLVLTVHADPGYTNEVQSISDLGSTNWQTAVSVVITNDPQTITLPMTPGAAGFWRLRTR